MSAHSNHPILYCLVTMLTVYSVQEGTLVIWQPRPVCYRCQLILNWPFSRYTVPAVTPLYGDRQPLYLDTESLHFRCHHDLCIESCMACLTHLHLYECSSCSGCKI